MCRLCVRGAEVQTEKPVEVQCGRGGAPERRRVWLCLSPDLAQLVDTDLGPDHKPPLLPEGKR